MATETYTHISTNTVSADTNSFTISSIPSGYKDLKLYAHIKADDDGFGQYQMTFNGDSGSNYGAIVTSLSSTADSEGYQTRSYIPLFWIGSINEPGVRLVDADIMNYRNSDFYTTVMARSSTQNSNDLIGGIWNNPSSVTSITFLDPNSRQDIAAGSVFSLFGIAG